MIRIRMKMKARFAILLCMASVFGVYTVIRSAVCWDNLSQTTSKSSMVLPHPDIVRRSFIAKEHKSKTLLSDIPETPKMVDVKTKFGERLGKSNFGENFDKPKAENENQTTDAEEGLFKNSNHEAGEESRENQQILAHEPTETDAATPNKYQNEAPAAGKQSGQQYGAEIGKNHNNPALQNFKNDIANQSEVIAATENNAPQHHIHEEQHVYREQEENHQNELLHEEEENGNVKEGENVKKPIETIFDPGDSEITYHALHDKGFKESQINKSREDDFQRTTEFSITPEEAMRQYGDQLPAWEQYEILHYPKIYYLGIGANKTQLQYDDTNNFGFDYEGDHEGQHRHYKIDNIVFILGKNNQSAGQLLKVADFGIGCILEDKQKFKCPAYYLQTRFYRAPEVILSLDITPQLDMFSVGVILAEIFIGRPPFYGENEPEQLACMMEVLGLPPTYMIANSPRKKIYQKAICYETENGLHRKPYRKPLPKVLEGMDPALFDLIARCLEYDPKLRITPKIALMHPFITGDVLPIDSPPPVSMQRLMGDI